MANRYLKRVHYSFEQDPVRIFGSVAIGATGAVGTIRGAGVATIARTGTGAYTITLSDAYHQLLSFDSTFGGTASGIGGVELVSTIATQKTDIQSKNIKIQCYSSGVTAADPANGTTLQFEVCVRMSSVVAQAAFG
jgi:hypothetical protein